MTADTVVSDHEVTILRVPERQVGDSQTHVYGTDRFDYLYLELETSADVTGVGIDLMELRAPGTPSAETIDRRVDAVLEDVVGANPLALLNRQTRPRGGVHDYESGGSYDAGVGTALDVALWDVAAKLAGEPLHAFMGATDDAVPVYASGLSFVNDDAATREIYESFSDLGEFRAAKVKVGHETVAADIERLTLVDDVFDGLDQLLIDANEAWSPSETTRRLRAFRDVGFDVFWVEDPVFRHDREGMARVVEGTPETHVTVGEYQGFEGKRALLEAGACDILNLQGLSAARRASTLAQASGTPVAMNTDHATDAIGVHAGCALPDVVYAECCNHRLLEFLDTQPYVVENGEARPTDRPGHGIEIPPTALEELGE